MARRSGLSRSTISRIWRAFALQPHRTETFTGPASLYLGRIRLIQADRTRPLALMFNPPFCLSAFADQYLDTEASACGAPDLGQLRHTQDCPHTEVFAKRPRFQVHFTPTSASWLNLVERWFALLTEKQCVVEHTRAAVNLKLPSTIIWTSPTRTPSRSPRHPIRYWLM